MACYSQSRLTQSKQPLFYFKLDRILQTNGEMKNIHEIVTNSWLCICLCILYVEF